MLKALINNKYLILIVVLGFALRIIGINHGFPFIFHPDEPTVVRSALGIRFYPNPAHFDWPHFYIYFNYFLYMAFAYVRNFLNYELFSFFYNDDWVFYFLTRVASTIFGTLTIVSTYFLGKSLFNKNVGLFSALGLAILPLHVQYSHYSLTEAPMLFFLTIALIYCTKIFNQVTIFKSDFTVKNSINYLLAGLFIGFSASTKYNAGILAFVVPFITFLGILNYKVYKNYFDVIKKLISLKFIYYYIIAGVFAIFGFLIGTPFSLVDFKTFTRTDGPKGALWQFTNVGSTNFNEQVVTFFNNIFVQLPKNTGYVIFWFYIILLAIFLISLLLKQNNKKFIIQAQDIYKLSFIFLPSFLVIWYMSGFEKSRSHYFMVVYPFLVLSFGYLLNNIILLNKNIFNKIFSVFIVLVPLYFSILMTLSFLLTDNRVELYKWIQSQEKSVINNTFIYDYNVLKDVFEKADTKNYEKGFDKISDFENGYIVVTDLNQNLPNQYKYELIKSFENKYARGDFIYIFEFSKLN